MTKGLNWTELYLKAFFFFNWNIADLQCCDSFRWTAKGLSHTYTCIHSYPGLPWWLSGKESVCQCRRPGFDPWFRKIPWRRKQPLIQVFLPGESHWQQSLANCNPWSHKRAGHDLGTRQVLPQIPIPSRLPCNPEQSSMHYTVGPCWFPILNITMHTAAAKSLQSCPTLCDP